MKQILLATIFAAGATAGICARQSPTSAAPPAQTESVKPNDYSDAKTWLCRPGRHDACDVDLTTTVVAPDGTLAKEAWSADPDAPIDCFYVYPTVSGQTTPFANMNADPAELAVVRTQFARFASKCKPYAPLYRQVTLPALRSAMAGGGDPVMDRGVGYNDIKDAWNYYIEHDNHGRGVVLIGHSQGSFVLLALLKQEIDGKPVQSRLVSAMLMGTTVPVPKGKDVGGFFTHIPICHSASDTGCVITYASFRASNPPPANSLFGRVADKTMVAACTNPAAVGGGSAALHSYFTAASARAWLTTPQPITTPWVSVPGLITAKCATDAYATFLEITVHPDARATDIPGDTVIAGQVQANWGLHTIDLNLGIGNLVDVVGQQAKAFRAPARQ